MQDMNEFLESMVKRNEYIGKYGVMPEFIKRATSGISKPVEVEKLDDLLIDEGIAEAVKLSGLRSINKGMLTKWMSDAGFKRKQIMTDGERSWYWVNSSIGKTGINAKMALREFLTNYLKSIDTISYDELTKVMESKGFTSDIWQSHFFHVDGHMEGMPKVWNDWILRGKQREKIYTCLNIELLNTPENDN